MNKKQLLTVALATTMLTTGIAMASTNAAEPTDDTRVRPTQEQREGVKDAIANNDYVAWAEALASHPKAEEFVNEATFSVLVQAHQLAEAGDREAAKELLQENDIKRPGRRGHGPKKEVREAVANGDYQAWAELLADKPNAEEFVNEATFATLQEAHALAEAGDKEGAKALLEEAGIKRPGKSRR